MRVESQRPHPSETEGWGTRSCFAVRVEWKNDKAAHRQANSYADAGADEDDLGDGWGLEEFGAYRVRRVAGCFLGEARDLRGGEGDAVEVGAAAVGIFAVTRRMGLGFCGEIH